MIIREKEKRGGGSSGLLLVMTHVEATDLMAAIGRSLASSRISGHEIKGMIEVEIMKENSDDKD